MVGSLSSATRAIALMFVAMPAEQTVGQIDSDMDPYLVRVPGFDYPATALARNEQGVTTVKLTLGPDETVQQCQTERSSGYADLDQAACALVGNSIISTAGPADRLTRLKFRWVLQWAKEEANRPIIDRDNGAIPIGINSWVRSEDFSRLNRMKVHGGPIVVTFAITSSGRIADCDGAGEAKGSSLAAVTCEILTPRAHFLPARNSSGQAIATTGSDTINWARP